MDGLAQGGTIDARVERIGFLLLPEFPIYALILATEALRIANQYQRRRLFESHLFSLDGAPVVAGNGMTVAPVDSIAKVPFFPTVIVVAGNQPTQHIGRPLLGWLRRLDRHGALLGAIDTGAFTLAAAGLLDGYRIAVHWEVASMFKELHPEIEVSEQLFVIDRNRITAAGGIATLDLMLHLIGHRQGQALAQLVASGFVHERIRQGGEPQRPAPETTFASFDSRLMRTVRVMEENMDPPLAPDELAARAGVSLRQLERLFLKGFGEPPMRYYLRLRLQAARNHLFYGDAPIQEVALAAGFSSPAVFSRTFRAHFGLAPREFRDRYSADRLLRFRPELRAAAGTGTW
jgi:transcriptional regulator GlxA family with amidase domain